MRLKTLLLRDFRGYREETCIDFDHDLTAIIGKNDVGKSTILEALEIFFNSGTVKADPDDLNVKSAEDTMMIGCVFDRFPNEVVLDENYPTSLESEYLVNADGDFEIRKYYRVGKTVGSPSIRIHAYHPTAEKTHDLHSLTLAQLKTRAKELGVEDKVEDQRVSSLWRKAIWGSTGDLALQLSEIEVSKLKESKSIYDKISLLFPTYALFKSDRLSSDVDPEANNPMQAAVKQSMDKYREEIDILHSKIKDGVMGVAERTLEKVREMDPELAGELKPRFKDDPKWTFKFVIEADDGIPVNKRGSGVRRLILLNFFRAEAEKTQLEKATPNVIYAIEEPETSQHPNYQQMLIESLIDLSQRNDCQIILTTHVPGLAELIPITGIRYLKRDDGGGVSVLWGTDEVMEEVATSLGVLPDSQVAFSNAVVMVEGPSDITFLNHASEMLKDAGILSHTLSEMRISPVPIGGCGNLKHWVTRKIVDKLGLEWCVLLDSDIGDDHQNRLNQQRAESVRALGRKAFLTKKREPENYIDPEVIKRHFSVDVEYSDTCDAKKIIAAALNVKSDSVLEHLWPLMDAESIISVGRYKTGSEERNEFEEIFEEIMDMVAVSVED